MVLNFEVATLLLFKFILITCNNVPLPTEEIINNIKNINISNSDIEKINKTVILNNEFVKKVCNNRTWPCYSENETELCAVQRVNGRMYFKKFQSYCYLFLSNICDHHENEYFITSEEKCKRKEKNYRREEEEDSDEDGPPPTLPGGIKVYDIVRSYDGTLCPLECINHYSPVCMVIDRGLGRSTKLYSFINACEMHKFYCTYHRTFEELARQRQARDGDGPPPTSVPGEATEAPEVKVDHTHLSWTLCAATRFIQMARFTEIASSLGHYGWLEGDYKPTHIMEPNERLPGNG